VFSNAARRLLTEGLLQRAISGTARGDLRAESSTETAVRRTACRGFRAESTLEIDERRPPRRAGGEWQGPRVHADRGMSRRGGQPREGDDHGQRPALIGPTGRCSAAIPPARAARRAESKPMRLAPLSRESQGGRDAWFLGAKAEHPDRGIHVLQHVLAEVP